MGLARGHRACFRGGSSSVCSSWVTRYPVWVEEEDDSATCLAKSPATA